MRFMTVDQQEPVAVISDKTYEHWTDEGYNIEKLHQCYDGDVIIKPTTEAMDALCNMGEFYEWC